MATMSEIPVDCKAVQRLAIAAAMGVHILLFLAIRYEMRPQMQKDIAIPPARDVPLEVRFIERAPPRTPVSSEPTQSRPSLATRPAEPLRKMPKATPAASQTPLPTPERVPFSRSSAADPPATQKSDPTEVTPDYRPQRPTDSAGVMSHRDIVGYTKSRFDDAWAPRDENVVSRGLRRAQDAATIKKTLDLGHGVRVHCAVGPLGGGCGFGDAPSKAAAKDGDVRLSMAPATALVKDMPGASSPPSEAECVAAYRADARVPQGCPSNTPLKAMDAENAERVRRTGL
jgi:hypothetical protein